MTQYISAKDLAARYNVNKATIWRWVKLGIIPKPIKFTEQCTRWSLEDIEHLDNKRQAARDCH